jgi:hypothetical protein
VEGFGDVTVSDEFLYVTAQAGKSGNAAFVKQFSGEIIRAGVFG